MTSTTHKKKRGQAVSGEFATPEWMQAIGRFGIAVGAGVFGLAVRIAEQMQTGVRKRFWSWWLVTDLFGLMLTVAVSAGIAEYLALGAWGTSAIAVVLGRGGPSFIDSLTRGITNANGRPHDRK